MKTLDKQRWETETRRPGRGGSPWRRRIRFLIFVLLATLVLHGVGYGLGAYLYSETSEESVEEPEKQVADAPAVEQQPIEPPVVEQEEPEPAAPSPPQDPTLYLTVPKLGIQGHTVRNDRSEEALDVGAIKLPSTGFPWEEGANTYIACHRLGFPGTESYNQCLNLPSMQQGDEVVLADSEGTVYRYMVSEALTVLPGDTWVAEPVAGRDVISLQTCIEAPGDFLSMGPNWTARFVIRADRVV